MKKSKAIQERKSKGTLDKKHTEKLQEFTNLYKSLPEKRKKLETYERELAKLKATKPSKYTDLDIHRKSTLMDKIDTLVHEIKYIESETDCMDYISVALPFLVDYYDVDNSVDDGIDEEIINNTVIDNKNSVMSYILRDSMKNEKKLEVESNSNVKKKVSRAKLYDSYLDATEFGKKKIPKQNQVTCSNPDCGGPTTISQTDGSVECTKCGFIETILITNDKSTYKEKNQDATVYMYKRINHLQEILSQLQAKESTEIPATVYADIYKELKKKKINKNDLEIFKLKRILKRLNYRKYYEHVPHILQNINGKEPPNFSRNDETKIRNMFKDIQKPFELFCPKNRKNFLNYSYVLHKFCELLGLDEYIAYFPLLKNSKKLLHHDKIWKNICAYMKWEFIKSI